MKPLYHVHVIDIESLCASRRNDRKPLKLFWLKLIKVFW